MRIDTSTTKVVTCGDAALDNAMEITLAIDGEGMIHRVDCMGFKVPIEAFDRISAVVALHRASEERDRYRTALKCCPDHGYFTAWRCEACASPCVRAAEAMQNNNGGVVPVVVPLSEDVPL